MDNFSPNADRRHVVDGQTILEHASMHVSEGEMVYIIGAVGSGKSSLLKTSPPNTGAYFSATGNSRCFSQWRFHTARA